MERCTAALLTREETSSKRRVPGTCEESHIVHGVQGHSDAHIFGLLGFELLYPFLQYTRSGRTCHFPRMPVCSPCPSLYGMCTTELVALGDCKL